MTSALGGGGGGHTHPSSARLVLPGSGGVEVADFQDAVLAPALGLALGGRGAGLVLGLAPA